MKERKHKEWKVYGKTFFPSFGCFEREERKFDLGGLHCQILSLPDCEESWIRLLKFQNYGIALTLNFEAHCII